VPVKPQEATVPYEQLRALQQQMRDQPAAVQQAPQYLQLVPVPAAPQPGETAAPAAPAAAPVK
jgi:hypothetical protein